MIRYTLIYLHFKSNEQDLGFIFLVKEQKSFN